MAKSHLYLCYDLMSFLNATVKMISSNDVGVNNSHLTAEITNGNIDFSGTGILFRSARVQSFEYLRAPVQTYAYFYFRTPSLSYTDNLFVLPFAPMVWYSFLSLIGIMFVLLTVIMHFEWRVPLMASSTNAESAKLLQATAGETFVIIFGATCQQGSAVTPQSFTARIFVIVSFISLMFLYTSYSANIVALLQSPSNKIRTLQDMLDSQLVLGMDTSPYAETYFPVEIGLLQDITYLNYPHACFFPDTNR